MEYYKDLKKTKNIVGRKGPRDLQRRQIQQQVVQPQQIITTTDPEVVKELRNQVSSLLGELAKRPVAQEATGTAIAGAIYTAEEFDKELIKQVTAATENVEVKHLIELKSVKSELKAKDDLLASKDETIESLRLRAASEDMEFIEDPDRPVMEAVFIDPNEKGDGESLVSHIEVEGKKDADIGDQVNKLKGLIGGLPK